MEDLESGAKFEDKETPEEQDKAFFVYFAPAHQKSRYMPPPSGEPILVIAKNAVEAIDFTRYNSKVRGIKRNKLLNVEEVKKEVFSAKAKELLEQGARLPTRIIKYTGLRKLARELEKQGRFSDQRK